MAERLLKVKGTQLYYEDYSEVAHLLTGTVVEGSFDGNLKVKGTYLHYMGNGGVQYRLLGTLTGETLAAGRIKNKGDYLYYGDINDAERRLAPVTIFYSDPHPEVSSVDGLVGRIYTYPNYETWSEIRDGEGTEAADDLTLHEIRLNCGSASGKYTWLRRTIHLFDTSVIPVTATILEASLSIIRNTASNSFTSKPALGVYDGNPASDIALVMADYNTLGSTLLSSVITYDTFAGSTGPHTMVFTQAGLDAINKGGITKLAIRDATRDGPNNDNWEESKYFALVFWSVEAVLEANRPYLTVKYL